MGEISFSLPPCNKGHVEPSATKLIGFLHKYVSLVSRYAAVTSLTAWHARISSSAHAAFLPDKLADHRICPAARGIICFRYASFEQSRELLWRHRPAEIVSLRLFPFMSANKHHL